MAKLTTTDLTSLTSNEANAVSAINENFAAVETAMELTLTRTGTSPNEMESDLDMNSYDIINCNTGYFANLQVGGEEVSSQDLFNTIAVAGQSNIVADSPTDTLTFAAGSNITLTTNAGTDTITISAPTPAAILADGDYGDITVSGTGTVMNIDAGVVSTTELGGDITTAGKALLDDANASAQRTTLGLGTLATANTVNDDVWSGTDLAVANGGTGSSNAADARTALGLVIGTNVQAYDAELTQIAALADPGADRVLFWDDSASSVKYLEMGANISITDTTINVSSGTATLGDGDYGDIVVSGTGTVISIDAGVIVDADINASAAIAATKIADGSVSDAEFQYISTLSSNAQTQIDGKQPLDSDLTTIAGLTATTDNFLQSKSSAWASRTPTQVTADLIDMVGDSGSGGTKGLVPAPASGDAAASKFLKADGTWAAVSAAQTTGSWTPVIAFGGASVGVTYTIQAGRYVRTGNLVMATGQILLSSNGSSTGSVTITGLPFTSKNTTNQRHAPAVYIIATPAGKNLQFYVEPNTTSLVCVDITNASVATEADIQDACHMILTLMYECET